MSRIEKVPVPTWALNYIHNGETEGLFQEEVDMIEQWMKDNNIEAMDCPEESESPYFSYYPPFGLGCDVVECNVLIKE